MHDIKSNASSFAAYTRAAFAIPQLTPELEKELIREYKDARKTSARNKIIESHLRLAIMLAKMVGRHRNDQEDLIQEGTIAMVSALDKFDVDAGVRFAVYAAQWIKARMKQYMRDNTRLVRVVTTKAHQKCFYNLHRYKREERAFNASELKMIAEELNVPEADVREMEMRLFSADHSIHLSVEEGGVSESLIDELDPADVVEQEEWEQKMGQEVIKAVNNLDERGRHIINGRVLTSDIKTLEYFSQVYNVSREAIRQAETKALSKVKQAVLMAA